MSENTSQKLQHESLEEIKQTLKQNYPDQYQKIQRASESEIKQMYDRLRQQGGGLFKNSAHQNESQNYNKFSMSMNINPSPLDCKVQENYSENGQDHKAQLSAAQAKKILKDKLPEKSDQFDQMNQNQLLQLLGTCDEINDIKDMEGYNDFQNAFSGPKFQEKKLKPMFEKEDEKPKVQRKKAVGRLMRVPHMISMPKRLSANEMRRFLIEKLPQRKSQVMQLNDEEIAQIYSETYPDETEDKQIWNQRLPSHKRPPTSRRVATKAYINRRKQLEKAKSQSIDYQSMTGGYRLPSGNDNNYKIHTKPSVYHSDSRTQILQMQEKANGSKKIKSKTYVMVYTDYDVDSNGKRIAKNDYNLNCKCKCCESNVFIKNFKQLLRTLNDRNADL